MSNHIWFMDGHCETDVVHYGVKGMRWGVIRSLRNRKGLFSKKKKKKVVEEEPKKVVSEVDDVDGPVKSISSLRRMKSESYLDAFKNCSDNIQKPGWSVNSQNCAIAIDMRNRGYDVKARSKTNGVYNAVQLASCYKDGKYNWVDTLNDWGEMSKPEIRKKLGEGISKGGDGHGILYAEFGDDSSCYAMNYECKKGKVTLYDGQTGKKGEDVDAYLDMFVPTDYAYIRTDNLELSDTAANAVKESK